MIRPAGESDRYVEDASFVRFRSATFSYNFTKPFLKKWKLDDLRVYVTADNLLTFTNYRGQDPEVNILLEWQSIIHVRLQHVDLL